MIWQEQDAGKINTHLLRYTYISLDHATAVIKAFIAFGSGATLNVCSRQPPVRPSSRVNLGFGLNDGTNRST